MKFFAILMGFVFATINAVDIDDIRNSYRYAKQSKENTEKFYQLTQQTIQEKEVVFSAYHGVALTLKASYADSRMDKISFFRKGKKMIEAAIALEPNNIELRMIRISVQSNAPRITGYRGNIDTDKNFILEHIDKIPSEKLKHFIKGFISNSEVFTKT